MELQTKPISEKSHILKVLRKTLYSLKNKNYLEIKNLSNKIIHNSFINENPDILYIAVVLYSLSKLIERETYKTYDNWKPFYKNYIQGIKNLIKYLEEDDLESFHTEIKNILDSVNRLSGNLKIYIKEVFRKAKINRASRIYEHGASMEKTAKILGITIWELAEYAGKTGISDINLAITLPVKKRLEYLEEIFGG